MCTASSSIIHSFRLQRYKKISTHERLLEGKNHLTDKKQRYLLENVNYLLEKGK